MLSWSRTAEEIVTRTQTGGRREVDKRKSKVKQEVANRSDVGSSRYAHYCRAAVSTDSKCNEVVKGAVVYNVPPLDGVLQDADTSPDQRRVLPLQL